jgi:hypothetical protein
MNFRVMCSSISGTTAPVPFAVQSASDAQGNATLYTYETRSGGAQRHQRMFRRQLIRQPRSSFTYYLDQMH